MKSVKQFVNVELNVLKLSLMPCCCISYLSPDDVIETHKVTLILLSLDTVNYIDKSLVLQERICCILSHKMYEF